MSTTHNLDVAQAALDRLAEQYKSKTKVVSFFNSFLGSFQALEDAIYSIVPGRALTTAVGVQLDTWGKILDLPRGAGWLDSDYRIRLQGKIASDSSSGTPAQICALFALIASGLVQQYVPSYPAGFLYYFITPTTQSFANILAYFMALVKAGGVAGIGIWYPDTDPNMFFAETSCVFASVGFSSGTSSFLTTDPTGLGFPSSGSVVIDYGLSTQETCTYTVVSSSGFSFSPSTTKAHVMGSTVALVGSRGLGFDTVIDTSLQISYGHSDGTTMPCSSSAGFPSSGTVVLSPGKASEETMTYTAVGSGVFTMTTAPVNSHAAFDLVVLIGSTGAAAGKLAGAFGG